MMCGCNDSQLMSHNSICLLRKVLESVHNVDSSTRLNHISCKLVMFSEKSPSCLQPKPYTVTLGKLRFLIYKDLKNWFFIEFVKDICSQKIPGSSRTVSGGHEPVNSQCQSTQCKIMPVIPSTVVERLKVLSIKCYGNKFEGKSLSIFWDGWSDGQPQSCHS